MVIFRRFLGVFLAFIGLFLLMFEVMEFEISNSQWAPFEYTNMVVSLTAGFVLMREQAQKNVPLLGGLLWIIALMLVLYYSGHLKVSDPNDGAISIVDWDWINYLNIVVSLLAGYFLIRKN